ncbi:amidoligase family protein [Kordiimonas sp.]|uniref:amidoligase family protein n=1 Tax=Kordiimonas sp. TaxID=1970157 RepID=UPI003A957684
MRVPENSKAVTRTERGRARKVGFEIEYAGVPLWRAARIVQKLFGGDIEELSKAEWYVADTTLGHFRLEIDAEPVKKILAGMEYKAKTKPDGFDRLMKKTADAAGDVVTSISEKIAPLEIIAPPILIDEIAELDRLREALFFENAQDTQSSLHHAFGLHINPEAVSLEAKSVVKHIQSFALLYPLLKELHAVDIARRMTPFIEPYSDDYLQHLLADDYEPTMNQLIRDYHRFNPSRNKALDMLPMFAELDSKLVQELYGEDEKINARPTYHYRLPNCEVSNGSWSLMTEWDRWLLVESLALDEDHLKDMKREYREDPQTFSDKMSEQGTVKAGQRLSVGGG